MKIITVLTPTEQKVVAAMITNLKKQGWGVDNAKEAATQLIQTAEKNEYTGEDELDNGYFTDQQSDMEFYERWAEELEEKFDWNNGEDSAMELMAAHYMALTVL